MACIPECHDKRFFNSCLHQVPFNFDFDNFKRIAEADDAMKEMCKQPVGNVCQRGQPGRPKFVILIYAFRQ